MKDLKLIKKLKKTEILNMFNEYRASMHLYNYAKHDTIETNKFIQTGNNIKKHLLTSERRYLKDNEYYIIACGEIWDVVKSCTYKEYQLVPIVSTPRHKLSNKVLKRYNLGYYRKYCDLGF